MPTCAQLTDGLNALLGRFVLRRHATQHRLWRARSPRCVRVDDVGFLLQRHHSKVVLGRSTFRRRRLHARPRYVADLQTFLRVPRSDLCRPNQGCSCVRHFALSTNLAITRYTSLPCARCNICRFSNLNALFTVYFVSYICFDNLAYRLYFGV